MYFVLLSLTLSDRPDLTAANGGSLVAIAATESLAALATAGGSKAPDETPRRNLTVPQGGTTSATP